jgi:hypothetical protein
LEKSTNGLDFFNTAVFLVSPEMDRYSFNEKQTNEQVYYRLKLINDKGMVTQSQVLAFKPEIDRQNNFKVYPTVVNTSFTATLNTTRAGQATIELMDLNGRTMMRKNLSLALGMNNIQVFDLGRLSPGSYVVTVRGERTNFQSTIIKQ